MNSESRHFDAVVPAPFGAIGIRTSAGAVSEITYLPKSARTVLPKNGLSDRAARQIERYLVDAATLLDWTGRLGGELVDPLKTTVVHDQRAMTTWVARRR